MIEGAIQRGATLYNNGQAAACAAVYETAASALLMYEDDLPAEARRSLRMALRGSANTMNADDRAWIMRRGLDAAAASLTAMAVASDNH